LARKQPLKKLNGKTVQPPDFERNVHCVLGLPFDAITMTQAQSALQHCTSTHTRCFFSTPNLNFLIACQSDSAFRLSVIASDLVLADGMPVVWLCKLIGIPIRERVAGSTLFENMRAAPTGGRATKVYFFGGPEGVAQEAFEKINADNHAMQCVGYTSPGFGSIQDMSSAQEIEKINASGANFLVVSLGARKGQAWIMHNLQALQVPVISHLGAVVNFVAGNVKRAPRAFQRMGLEWLWRIKEEPQLWRRYFDDALGLFRLGLLRVLPSLWHLHWVQRPLGTGELATVSVSIHGDDAHIVLEGACTAQHLGPYRDALKRVTQSPHNITIRCGQLTRVDSSFLGLTILLYGQQTQIKRTLTFEALPPTIEKVFRYSGADYLLRRQ
jgi:N-acetylglucosaminyldiphosphoundecaprenol N-acetyl-beta-D-mannosaminyltransferase